MRVSVVYALPGQVWENVVDIGADATLRTAIEQSGVLNAFPALRLDQLNVGVYSKLRPLDVPAREGDRIEIYRLLQVDPKEARRIRAEVRRRAMR
jgi:hypothetical protein